jgi:hypothetical protein
MLLDFIIVLPFCSNAARRNIRLLCFVFIASVFWATVVAGTARYFFALSENQTVFYILLPVAILIAVILYPKFKAHIDKI